MSETPLQRLLRLKKEKENASPALETVQGQSPETGTGNPSPEVGDSSVGRGELLPEEASKQGGEQEVLANSELDCNDSNSPAPVVEAAVVPAKPMSAMDRLRALKSGGVKPNGTVQNNPSGTGINSSELPSANSDSALRSETSGVELVPKILKERKTHPIAMEMAELEAALDAEVPGFVSILSQIHKKLRADPDVVTLLDDEEIGVIVAGLEKHTNVTIVAPSAIKAAKSKARKEPVTAMDL